ncbi:MAG: PBSX family phage terminase large subunit [Clostridia bacterium]|nr:PBSX family phage terminase large subunit [Clostridia bacterium]
MLRLDRIFSQKQIDALGANARYNIFEGSVRSGKTHVSFWWWCRFVKDFAPKQGDLLMVGKTERTLERNIINPMIEVFGSKRLHYSKGMGEGEFMGRRFYVAGANDERSQDKIRGMTLAGAYGDEITLWPESFWEMLRSRLSPKGARFLGTTNPDSPYHWLKAGTLDRESELNLRRVRFRLEDNTFLDPSFVDDLKREYTGLWYRRFILGEWCQAEGTVYDMWDEARHVKKNPISNIATRDYSIDYGTSNPTVFLECVSGEGRYHVSSEYYWDSREKGRQKTDGEYADDLIKFMGDKPYRWVIVDPSAASFIAELKRRRIKVQPAVNDVLDGIRETAKMLANDSLSVSPECPYTRGDFSSYVWDTQAQRRGEDKPLKQHDHAADAVRYWVMTVIFGRRPMSINTFSGEVI